MEKQPGPLLLSQEWLVWWQSRHPNTVTGQSPDVYCSSEPSVVSAHLQRIMGYSGLITNCLNTEIMESLFYVAGIALLWNQRNRSNKLPFQI